MKKQKEIKNLPASVREKLRNISIEGKKDFQSVLRQYIQERFLYRVSQSFYADTLILKGALLFLAYNISRLRPTRDIDFLVNSISNEQEDLKNIVKEILSIIFNDGLTFDKDDIVAENIVEDEKYHEVRVKFNCYLGNARERIQVDFGFGDEIIAGPVEILYPTLLDFPAPKLKVYSIESAIAEKFEAMVSINQATSRMKDFYDVMFFASDYKFNKRVLKEAIIATFKNRNTDYDTKSLIFGNDFKKNPQKQQYWLAFLKRNKLNANEDFAFVVEKIQTFIEPIFIENNMNSWNKDNWQWE
ncbi:MAG: nucleotidyl transferase AbiEii/AbiGii toxin family protein [Bacteroidetes bacterium]|nr:nucleotidyl transferase AbiEii/AbiGii toxin family protein [Bacteroidota bacterium]MBU2584508.1 nucleotidyl transferase AbiEii/AbiGii toxin family protein [Bacteroidota bacterium]